MKLIFFSLGMGKEGIGVDGQYRIHRKKEFFSGWGKC